ncbi:hypothetical protein CHS0354_040154 [Potamilus streckersoni]|uniref:Uncharacterized protein n=1 Tax=Potamilus streckersoni TaxID=2493646 RepID=A0AAE0W0F5_9BIVA|nr:hypothetical protein CHS0354_040154 [Potamilus streckersoni]
MDELQPLTNVGHITKKCQVGHYIRISDQLFKQDTTSDRSSDQLFPSPARNGDVTNLPPRRLNKITDKGMVEGESEDGGMKPVLFHRQQTSHQKPGA